MPCALFQTIFKNIKYKFSNTSILKKHHLVVYIYSIMTHSYYYIYKYKSVKLSQKKKLLETSEKYKIINSKQLFDWKTVNEFTSKSENSFIYHNQLFKFSFTLF